MKYNVFDISYCTHLKMDAFKPISIKPINIMLIYVQ